MRIEATSERSHVLVAMILPFILGFQISYSVAKVLELKKKKFSQSLGSMISRHVSGSVQLRWGKPQKEFSALCIYGRYGDDVGG